MNLMRGSRRSLNELSGKLNPGAGGSGFPAIGTTNTDSGMGMSSGTHRFDGSSNNNRGDRNRTMTNSLDNPEQVTNAGITGHGAGEMQGTGFGGGGMSSKRSRRF